MYIHTVGRVDGAWAGRSVVPSFQPFFARCRNAAQELERRGGIAAVVEDRHGVAANCLSYGRRQGKVSGPLSRPDKAANPSDRNRVSQLSA